MTEPPTSREAEEYFHAKGLTFDDIGPMEFRVLEGMVAESLLEHNHGEDVDPGMDLTLGGSVYCKDCYELGVDGAYFVNRTCVLINRVEVLIMPWAAGVSDRFVTVPFVKWCDMVAAWKDDGTSASTVRRVPVHHPHTLMWAVCTVKAKWWNEEELRDVECVCIKESEEAAMGQAKEMLSDGWDVDLDDVWVFPYRFGDSTDDLGSWNEEDAWKASEHMEAEE